MTFGRSRRTDGLLMGTKPRPFKCGKVGHRMTRRPPSNARGLTGITGAASKALEAYVANSQ